jgi:hypothetical protein
MEGIELREEAYNILSSAENPTPQSPTQAGFPIEG